MTCLIIDDEILAQDVIEHYIARIPTLELLAKCDSAIDAFAFLSDTLVDLIFLDIKMPGIGGLDFLRLLKSPPKVILTTAYAEYAIEGYELNVVDYLLKPIAFERFLQAIHKAIPLVTAPQATASVTEDLYVKSDGKLIRLLAKDILYVESLKNYLLIHTAAQKIIVYSTMLSMIEQLVARTEFIRIHKSYLINKNHITAIQNNIVTLYTHELPIGAVYRADTMKRLGLG
ncbi:MAG: response regulator transcription factor [Sphingobacteriales bacterium]|nr:MAG: response regulator transcription factor [Sphingobacteriales bacterium]